MQLQVVVAVLVDIITNNKRPLLMAFKAVKNLSMSLILFPGLVLICEEFPKSACSNSNNTNRATKLYRSILCSIKSMFLVYFLYSIYKCVQIWVSRHLPRIALLSATLLWLLLLLHLSSLRSHYLHLCLILWFVLKRSFYDSVRGNGDRRLWLGMKSSFDLFCCVLMVCCVL